MLRPPNATPGLGGPAAPLAQCSTVGGEMSSPLGHACWSLYDFGCPFPPLGLRNPSVSSNGFMTVLQVRGRDLAPSPRSWEGLAWRPQSHLQTQATAGASPEAPSYLASERSLQANLSEAAHKAPQCNSHGYAVALTPPKAEVAVHLGERLSGAPQAHLRSCAA